MKMTMIMTITMTMTMTVKIKNKDKVKMQAILSNFVILLISHDKSRNSYYVIDINDMTAFPIL